MSFDASKGPGRVFFSSEASLELEWVAYQPLENHVENVRYLLKQWRTDGSDLAVSAEERERLYQGAKFHDWGKTRKFSIRKTESGQKKHWTYSYAGHRFLNPPEFEKDAESSLDDLYHLMLERAHHDYSVQEIVHDTYDLKQQGVSKYGCYPRDLFILEMCDQIEAEVAVMAVQGKAGRNSSFMEFEVSLVQDKGTEKIFRLEPFPFETEEVRYTLAYRKDEFEKHEPKASVIREKGFEPYDPLTVTQIVLKGSEPDEKVEDDIQTFYERASDGDFSPNALQLEVWQQWQGGSAGLIVKAPTGVGKTEACVFPPLAQNKRVVLVLPAKALVDDHRQRFETYFERLCSTDGKQRRLLVDTGDDIELHTFPKQPDDKPDTNHRHLYRADLILTTLDKFLYRFFGYGGGRKSYTYPLRIGDTSRMAFVFDEAHSYEGTSFTNFQRLVTTLYDQQHNVTLMTATLPDTYQRTLQDPDDTGFAGRWDVVDFLSEDRQAALLKDKSEHYGKRHLIYLPDDAIVDFASIEDFEEKQEAFEEQKRGRIEQVIRQVKTHWTGGNRLIVTVDRVVDAAEVYQTLRQILGDVSTRVETEEDANLFLYHGRLDRRWRSDVYKAIKQRDDNEKPYILVSTSAIEIGVDLDANVLITEICNPDALVQRIGRCNRRGKDSSAKVVVVGSQIPDYLDAFGENREAFEQYLYTLRDHDGRMIDAEFARNIVDIFPKPVLSDPRASTAYDMLYKYVYDFDLEYRNLHDLGFIATRSWDPTIEVLIPQSKDAKGNAQFDRLQVPTSRLSRGTDDAYWIRLETYKMHRDNDKSWRGQWEKVTRGGDLYRGSYRIILDENSELCQNYRRDLGLVELPRVFQRQRWTNDPPLKVRLSTWIYERTEEQAGTFFFASGEVENKEKGKRLVFSYLADPNLDSF